MGVTWQRVALMCCGIFAGIHLARKISKLGMHSSDTAEIFFEDVRIPQSHLIGEEGKGFVYQMLQFQEERLFSAAASQSLSHDHHTSCNTVFQLLLILSQKKIAFSVVICHSSDVM